MLNWNLTFYETVIVTLTFVIQIYYLKLADASEKVLNY